MRASKKISRRGVLVLDSGAISAVADNRGRAKDTIRDLREQGFSLCIPLIALVECLTGDAGRDANANRFLAKIEDLMPLDHETSRMAAALRYRSRNPSVVDAVVAATAFRARKPAIVLTSDPDDLERLVSGAREVSVIGC